MTLHRVTVIVDSRNEQHRTADHPTSRHQSASPARGPMEEIVGNTPEASKCISVRLFGTFEIRRNGASLFASDMGGRKPRHILEILLLNLGISVSKTGSSKCFGAPAQGVEPSHRWTATSAVSAAQSSRRH